MNRLSGDQKGLDASSLPAMGCASDTSSLRNQSCVWPFRMAMMARNFPSGEIAAGCVMFAQKPSPGGGRIAACTDVRDVLGSYRTKKTVIVNPSNASSAAVLSHAHRRLAPVLTAAVAELPEPDNAPSANDTSRAD